MNTNQFRNATLALAGSTLIVLGGSALASGTSTPAPSPGPAVPDDITLLANLAEQSPWLDVAGARKATDDAHGVVWITGSRDGTQVCLIDHPAAQPTQPPAAASGLGTACRSSKNASTEGIVTGLPGDWTAYVPAGTDASVRLSNGSAVAVASDRSRPSVVRLPPSAQSVTVGAKTDELPQLNR